MKYTYKTRGGICAGAIEIDIENDLVRSVVFHGGCPGNHLGIAALVKDMPVNEVIRRLTGITCGSRSTSCPGQLAEALKQYQDGQSK